MNRGISLFGTNGFGNGTVAQRLLANNGDVNCLRTNATLQKDEWKELDDVLVPVARDALVGVADLMSRGLVHEIKNGLATTIFEYEDVSKMGTAVMNMSGVSKGRNDQQLFGLKGLPLPITHVPFEINLRKLMASRDRSEGLDVSQGRASAEEVSEFTEDLLFNGSDSFAYGTYTIYGYTDFPDRNTVVMTEAWDAAGKTGEEILQDVQNMIAASIAVNHRGPFGLYIPKDYQVSLGNDFKANSDKSIRQRIMELEEIEFIRTADRMTGDNVILAELKANTVRMVQGMPLTPVEWPSGDGMELNFKIMQIRADQDGNCGVTHLAL